VDRFQSGDAVYGINDWFTNGAQAEYCIAPASALARKPWTIDHVQASVVPISALTAWQALFEKANLQSGQRVLVHGGAGGVGIFTVQLAYSRGAQVIATASTCNVEFVRSLGASQVIDYHKTRFEDVLSDVDIVVDTVGGETLDRSWSVLAMGGDIITVASQSEAAIEPRVRDAYMIVRPDGAQLGVISDLIDAGVLRVFVEGVFPLHQAREAFEHAGRGHMRGKVALRAVA
jgi:NADPH:quinone reductase-like Zn-dependent oxidoreductase